MLFILFVNVQMYLFIYFYFIKAKIASGEIKLNVHKDYRWVLPKEAKMLPVAPADMPVIEKLLEKR